MFFPPCTCGLRCCQIVLAWDRSDYVCLRIDYYSSGLVSRRAMDSLKPLVAVNGGAAG